MQLQRYSAIILISWVLAVCATGVVAGVTSAFGLATLAVVALVPPLFVRRILNGPAQSMSESIQAARR